MRQPESNSPHDETPDLHREAKALLFDALDVPFEERKGFLTERSRDRPRLRREVLELLAHTDGLDGFMEDGPRTPTVPDSPPGTRAVSQLMPTELGGLRILRQLGFGGMGVVYLAQQTQPKRKVAIKVLLGGNLPDPQTEARFLREIEILGRLKHPGIARVFDARYSDSEAGGASWFSMEYIEGCTLGEYCRTNELSCREIARLVVQIADVVAYAHELGILHRDLKPENILVGREGHPHLLDFGVARLQGEERGLPTIHTVTGGLLGTVAYMSPEQARGAQVDARSDVFSLGAILYELLCGHLPFESRGRSLGQLIRSITEDEPVMLSSHDASLRGELEAVVHSAIETDPASRYGSVAEFRDDLLRWAEHRPVLAREPTFFGQVRKLVRRNRGLAAIVGVIFLALAAALAASLWGLRESRLASEKTSRAFDDMVGFSRGYSIDDLVAESEALWPAGPGILPRLYSVLEETRGVVADIPRARAHLEMLAKLEREAALQARYGGELDGRWVLQMQEDLVRRIEALRGGLVADLESRVDSSEEVMRVLEASGVLWKEAASSVATSSRYEGLSLTPQLGLIPLGVDRDSGLHEFGVVLPGCSVPERDGTTGVLSLRDDSTIVLVLLGGGRVETGSQGDDPTALYFDPVAESHYWPVTERELLPFLVSKFEVTQHQWAALMGANPSYWCEGKHYEAQRMTARHPVESVTWTEAVEFCRRLGMTLPTEVQFEYAARAGSTAATWWGTSGPQEPTKVNYFSEENLDGHRLHAPVGTFPPNAFGLYEVMGNVAEFCLDDYKVTPWVESFRDGDALVLADGGGGHTIRGCSFDGRAKITLSARNEVKRDVRARTIGLRPVRYLEGIEPATGRVSER